MQDEPLMAFPSVSKETTVPRRRQNDFWRFSRYRLGSRFNGINASLPGALFNDNEATRPLKQESPAHRRMVTLAEQGYTAREIADSLGFNRFTVQNALRQPNARKHMIETMQQDVSQEIKRFLEAEVLPSLETLKSVRDSDFAKPGERVAAANALLDRHMGKPNQPFTATTTHGKSVSDMSVAELDAALAATGFVASSTAASVGEGRT